MTDSPTEAFAMTVRQTSVLSSVWVWAVVISCLGVGCVLAVTAGGLARACGHRDGAMAHACMRATCRLATRLLRTRYPLVMTGVENLPAGPCVLCANHASLTDVLFLYRLSVSFRWIAKRELLAVPLLGWAMRLGGYPIAHRGDASSVASLLDAATRLLRGGKSLAVFPEGTRSHAGAVSRFHAGAARMAIAAQVPVVPVGIVGTETLLPRGCFNVVRHVTVAIHVAPALGTHGLAVADARRLTRELSARVGEAQQQARSAQRMTAL